MADGSLLSRRTILHGLGVSMCLPLLEAMVPRDSRAFAAPPPPGQSKFPVRFAALYMPNGVNPQTWSPTKTGSDWELSPTLSPLAPVKSHVLVLQELMNRESTGGDGHYFKVAPFLTGTLLTKTTGGNLNVGGVSLDQLIASRIGNLTALPSLELSVEPVTTGVDTNVGLTRLYGSHISWNTPTTPVSREINPQMAFDRLFRPQNARSKDTNSDNASILDAVQTDAQRLNRKIGHADRAKLQEYFEAVRSVEKRIAWDSARRASDVQDNGLARQEVDKLGGRIKDWYAVPDGKRGIDHTEQVRLMLDIIALAFWTDSTRVATFMFANEVSGKNFSFIPGVSGGHHQISHHENDSAKLAEYEKINEWHVAQYSYLLQKLHGIKEGDGTLLDHSVVLFGSGIKDGNAHSPFNLPIVLAGKGGGLSTNRHLVYDKKTPLCNLYRTVLNCVGTPVTQFGDSTGELPGLFDPRFQGASAPIKS